MSSLSNPPWSDKILRSVWQRVVARMGTDMLPEPALLPRNAAAILDRVEDLLKGVASGFYDRDFIESSLFSESEDFIKARKRKATGFKEYGSGHYGCVMPTRRPGVVIKVTSDATEAAFVASYLSLPKQKRPYGIVPYHAIFEVVGTSRRRRRVFILWRDEASWVGIDNLQHFVYKKDERYPAMRRGNVGYYTESLRKVEKQLCLYRRQADTVRHYMKTKKSSPAEGAWLIDNALKVYNAGNNRANMRYKAAYALGVCMMVAGDLQDNPMGHEVGHALENSLDCGMLLADVHANNIGMPTGKLLYEMGETCIITDPGHAVAMDDRYKNVLIEAI